MNYRSHGESVVSNCLVTDKGFQSRNDHSARGYVVGTENCGTLSIRDSALERAGDQKVVYDSIQVGGTYSFTVVGKALLDDYPRIIEVTEVR